MPFNGAGVYIQVTPVASGSSVWTDTKAAGDVNITTADHDYHDQDMAAGLSNCVTRDGQRPPSANLPMGGKRFTGVGDAILDDQYISLAQLKASGPVVGSARDARMSVAAASATATFIAVEIVTETSVGGQSYRIGTYSQAVNLAATGAGGMDTGAAPVSGYVALYAIYAPATTTASILAVNATSSVAPNIYAGANMPSGYTASALISVWPTNSSRQFVAGYQDGRSVYWNGAIVLSTSSATGATPVSLSISSMAPPNARGVSGNILISSSGAGGGTFGLTPTSATFGASGSNYSAAGSGGTSIPIRVPISTPQTTYYTTGINAGSPSFQLALYIYDF